jgi:hypothetical protein
MKIIIYYLAISALIAIIIYLAGFHGRNTSTVYVCSEVTKEDPKDVQQICKKSWRRYE